jgi:hypothetical protein
MKVVDVDADAKSVFQDEGNRTIRKGYSHRFRCSLNIYYSIGDRYWQLHNLTRQQRIST